MAEFSKLVITKKGQALIAKVLVGTAKDVDFTKVATSTATYQVGELEDLTALPEIKQEANISRKTRTNAVAVKIETAFSNTNLTVGYSMNTLGLFAADPDDGEILYAVAVETSGNCYMPAYNGITVSGAYIQLVTTVGNADNVNLEVNPGAVATIGDIQAMEQEIADLRAFIGYTEADIYGVEVDFVNKKFTRLAGAVGLNPGTNFNSVNAFGGRKRCNVTDTGEVVAYHGDPAYTETGKLLQAVGANPVGTAVQTMVEQPRFYYKVVPLNLEPISGGKGYHMRKGRFYVSDTPRAGFKIHPAFVSNGKKKSKIYLSAFEACLYDNSAGTYLLNDEQVADFAADKLSSIGNAKPLSGLTHNLTRANTRTLAHNRGTGWEQSYAATVAASQLLMLIEYASFNMQNSIGAGVSTKVDDGATSMTEITGATTNLGNDSGAVMNANNQNIVTYRGEENIWGNIWTWVDGINEQNPSTWTTAVGSGEHGTMYVADHGFADDTSASPYEDSGIRPCYSTGGYISAFGYSETHDFLFIPTEMGGDSALPIGDYFWNAYNNWRVATLGGGWYYGSSCGPFCLYLHGASSSRYRTVGGRLVYVPSEDAA